MYTTSTTFTIVYNTYNVGSKKKNPKQTNKNHLMKCFDDFLPYSIYVLYKNKHNNLS